MVRFLLGIILIWFIVWNRLIREQILQYYDNITFNDVLKSIIFIIIFASLFIYTLITIYLKNNPKTIIPDKSYYSIISKFITEYIITPPKYVYEIMTRNFNLAPIIESPASYLVAHFSSFKMFVIIFYFIPQILVAFVFFTEIYYLHQKVFFIKILSLLLIFLISKTIIFVFQDYSKRRLHHLELFLDIKKSSICRKINIKYTIKLI